MAAGPQRSTISVVPADELLHADEAELEAFIQSLLNDQDLGGGDPVPGVLSSPALPSPPAPKQLLAKPRRVTFIPTHPAQAAKKSYHCGRCGATVRGHTCVAFRPHEKPAPWAARKRAKAGPEAERPASLPSCSSAAAPPSTVRPSPPPQVPAAPVAVNQPAPGAAGTATAVTPSAAAGGKDKDKDSPALLVASLTTGDGTYDVHRLDPRRLRVFTDLLELWRSKRRPPGPAPAPAPAPAPPAPARSVTAPHADG